MKEIMRLLGYGLGTLAVILLLVQVGSADSGGGVVFLAVLLVIVLPVVLGVILAGRAKRKEAENKH